MIRKVKSQSNNKMFYYSSVTNYFDTLFALFYCRTKGAFKIELDTLERHIFHSQSCSNKRHKDK